MAAGYYSTRWGVVENGVVVYSARLASLEYFEEVAF
jgi:hypothetical protein